MSDMVWKIDEDYNIKRKHSMEMSIITGGQSCSFTEKENAFLIGLTDEDGNKVRISRECMEMGLKMLSAIEPPPLQSVAAAPFQPNRLAQMTTPFAEGPMVVETPADPIASHLEHSGPTPAEQPKLKIKPKVTNKGDAKKAKVFLKELDKQRVKYFEDDDEKKDDGTINETMIKSAILQTNNRINKESMFLGLNKTIGMTQEAFDLLHKSAFKISNSDVVESD